MIEGKVSIKLGDDSIEAELNERGWFETNFNGVLLSLNSEELGLAIHILFEGVEGIKPYVEDVWNHQALFALQRFVFKDRFPDDYIFLGELIEEEGEDGNDFTVFKRYVLEEGF